MLRPFWIILVAVLLAAPRAEAQETVMLNIRDVIERSALYAHADGNVAVVLVHQSGYDAASWSMFASYLAKNQIASLALESTSAEDVVSGVRFLEERGFTSISIIGSSIGGGSSMQAASRSLGPRVVSIVLLGSSYGSLAKLTLLEKLFIVSEDDLFAGRTYKSFGDAAVPKKLVVFPGAAHGQDMFQEPYGDQLRAIIRLQILGS